MITEVRYRDLVLAIVKCPFDDERRLELAAWMVEKDDPRGRLIQEQCKSESDEELVQSLLSKHGRSWIAEDIGIVEDQIPSGVTVEFHKGFAWWPVQACYTNFMAAVAASNFTYVHPFVTAEGFCLRDKTIRLREQVVLYKLGKCTTRAIAISEMRKLRLCVSRGQIWTLLAFGERYPNVQLKFRIMAPGSINIDSEDDSCYMPCLEEQYARRRLELYSCDLVLGAWDCLLSIL